MCACWEIDPSNRPAFHEICETLGTFMSENEEYERAQTKEIEDNYYSQSDAGDDDVPIYCAQKEPNIPAPE